MLAWGKKVPADFADAVRAVAKRLGYDPSWLMATMAIETSKGFGYRHDGTHAPPWARNTHDGGGGLVGFTPMSAAQEQMTPVEQLDEVEKYYRRWEAKLKRKFASVDDVYLAVRGPYAIPQPDTFVIGRWPDGRAVTRGEVVLVARDVLRQGLLPENAG